MQEPDVSRDCMAVCDPTCVDMPRACALGLGRLWGGAVGMLGPRRGPAKSTEYVAYTYRSQGHIPVIHAFACQNRSKDPMIAFFNRTKAHVGIHIEVQSTFDIGLWDPFSAFGGQINHKKPGFGF